MEITLDTYNFEKNLDKLPSTIPVFPLNNALLLPKCRLPLNLFESRYLYMLDYALKKDRLIGMIQPADKLDKNSDIKNPELYNVGCAGLIVAFTQTNDNRYEIVLKGVSRYRILKETKSVNGFRLFNVKWDDFSEDKTVHNSSDPKKRIILEEKLKNYFSKININADWEAIEASSDDDLINSISMGCPFSNVEKQALLEAPSLDDRIDVLNSLIDMSINQDRGFDSKTLS